MAAGGVKHIVLIQNRHLSHTTKTLPELTNTLLTISTILVCDIFTNVLLQWQDGVVSADHDIFDPACLVWNQEAAHHQVVVVVPAVACWLQRVLSPSRPPNPPKPLPA
jgi:hypothetical protein